MVRTKSGRRHDKIHARRHPVRVTDEGGPSGEKRIDGSGSVAVCEQHPRTAREQCAGRRLPREPDAADQDSAPSGIER
jgi:hypothetical protein